MVFQAAHEDRRKDNQALGQLMESYWQPLYFYARRQGLSAADAEDATQSFLVELLEGTSLAAADPAKGRFRNYLLTLWKRFLIDRARFENRLKRGGGQEPTLLSCASAERAWVNWSSAGTPAADPDRTYCEQWARSVIDAALERLRTEYEQSRREGIFDTLVSMLTVPIQADGYRDLAARLGCSVGAAKVALHRLRQRFSQSLRLQVMETLDDPSELDAELQALMRYL